MFALTSNGYLFYSLPFLELYPDYICPEDNPQCSHVDRCNNQTAVEVDWDSHKSLHNWVDTLNLDCMNRLY